MNVLLSIIIVNYNAKDVLQNCLSSIHSNYQNFPFEVFVIDNASTESILELQQVYPDYTFIFNKLNLGFAAANNEGIKKARGEYILLLNPDTIVNGNSFQPMIDYLAEHKDVGIVGCKIYNDKGEIERSTHSFPTLAKEFIHANEYLKKFLNYDSLFGNYLKKIPGIKSFNSYWEYDQVKEVDHVTGACMMVKREAIEKAGLLDEAFFLYNEEVEWSYRIKTVGFKSVYLPDSDIIHLFGYSTKQRVQKQTVNRLLVERYRGMLYFYQKHFGSIRLIVLKIIVLQGFVFRLIFNYLGNINVNKSKKRNLLDERSFIKKIIRLVVLKCYDWRVDA